MTGTIERGSTKFLGCVVQAMVNERGVVRRVSLDSRTGNVNNVYEFYGCSKVVRDPFDPTTRPEAETGEPN